MQNRKNGIANVTGWIEAARARGCPRVREVADRQERASRLRLEMATSEPEDRERTERHDDDLRERK